MRSRTLRTHPSAMVGVDQTDLEAIESWVCPARTATNVWRIVLDDQGSVFSFRFRGFKSPSWLDSVLLQF